MVFRGVKVVAWHQHTRGKFKSTQQAKAYPRTHACRKKRWDVRKYEHHGGTLNATCSKARGKGG